MTYASPLGSAPEISEAIAAELRSGGHTAEVADMTNVVSLDSFTAVVIGILVYAGAYGLGDIGNFTKIRFSEQLTRMPVAVFIIGLLPEGMPPNVEYVMTNMKNALEPVTPAAMVLFCGILDRKKLSIWQRFTLISKILSGEFQDWDKIRAWAKTLPEQL